MSLAFTVFLLGALNAEHLAWTVAHDGHLGHLGWPRPTMSWARVFVPALPFPTRHRVCWAKGRIAV